MAAFGCFCAGWLHVLLLSVLYLWFLACFCFDFDLHFFGICKYLVQRSQDRMDKMCLRSLWPPTKSRSSRVTRLRGYDDARRNEFPYLQLFFFPLLLFCIAAAALFLSPFDSSDHLTFIFHPVSFVSIPIGVTSFFGYYLKRSPSPGGTVDLVFNSWYLQGLTEVSHHPLVSFVLLILSANMFG